MADVKLLRTNRLKRQQRIRAKIHGSAARPRLTVFRSNEHISLQVIDDVAGKTLASASDLGKENALKGTKIEHAVAVSKKLLTQLKAQKVQALVFDRSYYKYHGRVKAVAETLREGGIQL